MINCRCYTAWDDLLRRKVSVICPSCKEMEAALAAPYEPVFIRPQLMEDMHNG